MTQTNTENKRYEVTKNGKIRYNVNLFGCVVLSSDTYDKLADMCNGWCLVSEHMDAPRELPYLLDGDFMVVKTYEDVTIFVYQERMMIRCIRGV